MKMLLLFVVFNVLTSSLFCQTEGFVVQDTGKMFEGDIPFSIYKYENNEILFRSKVNDSTILNKKFKMYDTSYYSVFQTNLKGELNGCSYFLDRVKHEVSYAQYKKGIVKASTTLSTIDSDTIHYSKQINDTLFLVFEKNDSSFVFNQTDEFFRPNGFYKCFDLKTKRLIIIGNYRLICEKDIVNHKLFYEECSIYFKLKGLVPSVRNNNKLSIKVGEWIWLNELGEVLYKEYYNWESIK